MDRIKEFIESLTFQQKQHLLDSICEEMHKCDDCIFYIKEQCIKNKLDTRLQEEYEKEIYKENEKAWKD